MPEIPLERVKMEHSRVVLLAHAKSVCEGRPFPLHNRSQHSMRKFRQLWRDDRGIIERICPHGIGHPDPDQFQYWDEMGVLETEVVHGCDGCCWDGQ